MYVWGRVGDYQVRISLPSSDERAQRLKGRKVQK